MPSKDDLLAALSNLSPEQIQGILAQGNGRSPLKPRQLHDLRLPPTATDPRPLFIPSAEGFRDVPEVHSPYPRLMWHVTTGVEITVHSREEFDAKIESDDYMALPPTFAPVDPVDRARQMFDALDPVDQALVLEQQRQARIAAVTAAMGGLTAAQAMEAVGEPVVKRGPGRPRKTDGA